MCENRASRVPSADAFAPACFRVRVCPSKCDSVASILPRSRSERNARTQHICERIYFLPGCCAAHITPRGLFTALVPIRARPRSRRSWYCPRVRLSLGSRTIGVPDLRWLKCCETSALPFATASVAASTAREGPSKGLGDIQGHVRLPGRDALSSNLVSGVALRNLTSMSLYLPRVRAVNRYLIFGG